MLIRLWRGSGRKSQMYFSPSFDAGSSFMVETCIGDREHIRQSYPYPSGSINQHDGYSDEYAAYKAQALYTWLFSEKTKFTQDLRYRSQFDEAKNYFVYSKTAFVAKLSDIFSAGISYQVDYINEAAEGKNNTDKTTMFNLIIDY